MVAAINSGEARAEVAVAQRITKEAGARSAQVMGARFHYFRKKCSVTAMQACADWLVDGMVRL